MTQDTVSPSQIFETKNPKPLTHLNEKGEAYTRTAEVEEQIKSALLLEWPALIARASISDMSSPDFMKEEALIYFIRDALSRNEKDALRNLFRILFSRCAKYIHSCFLSFSADKQEDACQNVNAHVIDKIMNLKDDGGDFFQVRFWFALKRLILTEYGRQVKTIEEDEEKLVFLDEQVEGEEGLAPRMELPDNCISPEDLTILKAGLTAIQGARHRKAFILRYYKGWPIKSNDPEEVTLSSYFGVTPRTIQNWLDAAEESLAKWRKEKKR